MAHIHLVDVLGETGTVYAAVGVAFTRACYRFCCGWKRALIRRRTFPSFDQIRQRHGHFEARDWGACT